MFYHSFPAFRALLSVSVILFLGACNQTPNSSSDAIHYNMISLSESATRSVPKDEMTVNLMILEEGREPVKLTNNITEKINRILKLQPLKKDENQTPFSISLTERYSSRIKRNQWQEVAYIRIVGTDFLEVNKLIEKAQDYTRIQNVSFAISRQTKAQTENELTAEALQRLKERSKLVATNMGLKDFHIVDMKIGTQTTRTADDDYPIVYAAAAETPAAAVDVEDSKMLLETEEEKTENTPIIEPEKQDLSLTVQAKIQLY